jgi:hypothetical protein
LIFVFVFIFVSLFGPIGGGLAIPLFDAFLGADARFDLRLDRHDNLLSLH